MYIPKFTQKWSNVVYLFSFGNGRYDPSCTWKICEQIQHPFQQQVKAYIICKQKPCWLTCFGLYWNCMQDRAIDQTSISEGSNGFVTYAFTIYIKDMFSVEEKKDMHMCDLSVKNWSPLARSCQVSDLFAMPDQKVLLHLFFQLLNSPLDRTLNDTGWENPHGFPDPIVHISLSSGKFL